MTPDLLDDQAAALAVRCPDPPYGCGEPIGDRCTRRTATGERVPLEHLPAHPARLRAAGVVHAPLDSRDLRRG